MAALPDPEEWWRGSAMDLDEKLAAGDVVVLDGATGTEVARLGGDMNPAAWCAVANRTHPETVRRVHESYLEAGADVITTNTFATCRHVLEGAGLGDETVAINRRAVELAREARDRVAPERPVAIAGSMSNTVAWLPGTVGPDPAYLPSTEKEAANYREMADTLAEAGCDLLVMEMMLDVERATRVTEAALATGLPVWVGISTSRGPDGTMIGWDIEGEENGRLPEDYSPPPRETLETIIDALVALGPRVVGIMHSSVESTYPGLADPLRAVERPGDGLSRGHALRLGEPPRPGSGGAGGLRLALPALGGGRCADHRRLLRHHRLAHSRHGGRLVPSARGPVPASDSPLRRSRASVIGHAGGFPLIKGVTVGGAPCGLRHSLDERESTGPIGTSEGGTNKQLRVLPRKLALSEHQSALVRSRTGEYCAGGAGGSACSPLPARVNFRCRRERCDSRSEAPARAPTRRSPRTTLLPAAPPRVARAGSGRESAARRR